MSDGKRDPKASPFCRYVHITTNLLVQLLVGLPLELVHRWWRIAIVYLCGVLAGSLGSSVFDSKVSSRCSGRFCRFKQEGHPEGQGASSEPVCKKWLLVMSFVESYA